MNKVLDKPKGTESSPIICQNSWDQNGGDGDDLHRIPESNVWSPHPHSRIVSNISLLSTYHKYFPNDSFI